MINSIKKIISGILSFFIGLIGGKKAKEDQPSLESAKETKKLAATAKTRKSKGYFMELDEAEETPSVNGKQEVAAAKTAQPAAKESTKADAATKQPVAATATLDKATPSAATKVESGKADTATATKKNKTSVKDNAPKKEPQAEAVQTPKVQLEQTAEGLKPVPAKAPASSVLNKTQTETTFAPKYLSPSVSSNGRRRPGPNMSSFLDMARDVKTPG